MEAPNFRVSQSLNKTSDLEPGSIIWVRYLTFESPQLELPSTAALIHVKADFVARYSFLTRLKPGKILYLGVRLVI